MTKLLDIPVWREDVYRAVDVLPELENLRGKSVLITGVTGLVCSAVVDILLEYNHGCEGNDCIKIYAAGRSEEKTEKRFGKSGDGSYEFVYYDACDDLAFPSDIDYIIHGASNADPAAIMGSPVSTLKANVIGMSNLLEYGSKNSTKRLLFVSSSEIYGRKDSLDPFSVDEYGYVDILNPRSSYPMGKRAAETLCAAYAAEKGTDFVIARLGHIYGPTASEKDSRVSSAFAYRAARGENLVLLSDGKQIRSYCYCLDCATAILKVLLCGNSGEAYNISNPMTVVSIRGLAEKMAEKAEVKLLFDNPTREETKAFNPMDNSSLDSSKLIALGWKGLFDLDTGIEHTIQIIREMADQ
ncbi:MAG: NAD-dependent epimerase/dehydratase family protein [Oscillospiraceae bacterium]|nr:NAD-dependent epimerase/dehydratase family protein [Oscillospiraceae bacterium]